MINEAKYQSTIMQIIFVLILFAEYYIVAES